MFKYLRLMILGLVFGTLASSGCGPITPTSILMKGATWAGEQVIKKELKKRKAQKDEERGYSPSREHRSAASDRHHRKAVPSSRASDD